MRTTSPLLETGVASQTMVGESESGDRAVFAPFSAGYLVAAVDGLGHGAEAAEASRRVAATLERYAHESVIALFRRSHESARETRGVVMSLASFREVDGTLTWAGVGNVEGVLLRADPRANPPIEFLLLRGGGVGFCPPQLRAVVLPVGTGDTLVLATDGIQGDFACGLSPIGSPQRMAERILRRSRKGTDDALVVVARYLGT